MDNLNHIGVAWASYFGPIVVQNTVFLVVVFLALFALKNAPANVKYGVGLVGLLKLLLPPFIPVHLTDQANAVIVSLSPPAMSTEPTMVPNDLLPLSQHSARLEPLGFLFLLWIGATLLYLLATVAATLRLHVALRHSTEIPSGLTAPGLRPKHVRILRSDHIATPMTVGVLPTRVFVPAAWDHWTDERRALVLRHELAHITRRDGIVQFLQTLAQSLYLFHPLVWLLNQRLREYREMACDDVAVADEDDRLRYSRHLVGIAESAVTSSLSCDSASALFRRKCELLNRIAYQLKEGHMSRFSKAKAAFVLAGLVLLVPMLSTYVSSASPKGKPLFIDVRIADAETVVLDGEEMSLLGLAARLDASDLDPQHAVVRLIGDAETAMGAVFEVHKVLRDAQLFDVMYSMGTEVEIPLVLPSKNLQKKIQQISTEFIANLTIDRSGDVVLDEENVNLAELSSTIERRISEEPMLVVSVRMDLDTTYEDYVAALNQVKAGGAERIHIHDTAR